MDMQTIKVSTRSDTGKGPARRRRVAGSIPGVIYGENTEALSITVDAKVFASLVEGHQGEHAVVQVEVEDRPELSGPSMIKDVQHHPIRSDIMHADFLRIKLDEKIQTFVPITIVGHCIGVVEGGVPDHQLREIEIECLPLDVPDEIKVDITDLHIGDLLHVSDLTAPEKLEILTEPDRTVIAIHTPRVVAAAETEEAEGETEGEEPAAES